MIDRFEVGKRYRYTGRVANTIEWDDNGIMERVLDGNHRMCTDSCGSESVLEGLGPYSWFWPENDMILFEEVTEEYL